MAGLMTLREICCGFNCAASFWGRLGGITGACFNCAAPFWGRLEFQARLRLREGNTLQLCRPLLGAVSWGRRKRGHPVQALQLCRPLLGAVSSLFQVHLLVHLGTSIVPPPFGGG